MPTRHLTPPASEVIERIVLIGFMCSGKSTVAAALARRLEWRFVDFDVEIERREGRTIAEIVARDGDDHLRAMEADLTAELAHARGLVMAPGGGWITRPDLLESMRTGTLAVWLQVTPAEAVRRLLEDDIDRPLRDHPDPEAAIETMLRERLPLYRRADVAVPGDRRSVEQVAFEIEQLARTRGLAAARRRGDTYEDRGWEG